MRVIFCCATYNRPVPEWIASMEAAVPAIEKAFPGIEHALVFEIGSSYISHAAARLLRGALDAKADFIIFLDDDLSFPPEAMVKLIATQGDVVAGTYRYREEGERYMGYFWQIDKVPCYRADGAIEADRVPQGFLKISKEAVDLFMRVHPELCFGPHYSLSVDLFAHGVHKGEWWGQDYAFCRRWVNMDMPLWLIPDLDITHHDKRTGKIYPGNLQKFINQERAPCASSLPALPASSGTMSVTTFSDIQTGTSPSSTGSTIPATSTD